ncbi:hypothetical protein UQW22_08595 [Isoptericola halotolerans]|uniref:hypothetical protein n=1 Tax=Isoptericola halotolerans TaxID=300560 RepID=UPI00388DC2B6
MADDVQDHPTDLDPAGPDPAALEERVERAQRDATLLADYLARRERSATALHGAEQAVARAEANLSDESGDVDRLESLSLARLWASLRGDRDARLDDERAELRRAEYALAAARTRQEAARRELARAQEAVDGLGDVAGRRLQALADKEAWLWSSGTGRGAELVDIAERRGRRQAELVEIAEAQEAADGARHALDAAAEELAGADGWSTYDTYFGGDLLASMAKHDRLDRAAERARAADAALAHLAVELGDVGERGVGRLGVEGMARTFDIWFDNVFSDLSVARHIRDSRNRVDAARAAVAHVAGRLADRLTAVEKDLVGLDRRRENLLLT